jgi:hypothetical protein
MADMEFHRHRATFNFVLTVEASQSDTVWSLVNAEWDALQTRFEQLAAQHGFELDPEPSFDWRRE